MKNFISTAAIVFAATIFSYGQGQPPVIDTHPNATIYIYDRQTSQEVLAESDAAILFKDALVRLVSNTNEAKMVAFNTPGYKTIVITQASPDQGNAYQVEMDDQMHGQTSVLYTFSYNVDQNALYFFDQNSQTWVPRHIQPYNLKNLDDCQAYGKFNDPQSWNEQASDDDGTGEATVQASTPPPPLQDEVQPECPVDGYLWQPGYWAYNNFNANYYWVPGVWVAPPNPGYLWTPPYWGFEGGVYGFHRGYWGLTVGFYGGINYGYGYVGHGFYGGAWDGGHFRYNTAVLRVNVNVVHNTYVDRTVIVNRTVTAKKVSFNGPGGVDVKPTREEVAATTQKHIIDTKQDPAAPRQAVRNQRGVNGTFPGSNAVKTTGNSAMPNSNVTRTPANGFNNTMPAPNTAKAPVNGVNIQKASGNAVNTNTSRTPGNGPGIPRVPGKGPGAVKPNQPITQQGQGQYGSQKGNNKQATKGGGKTQPAAKDKKDH